VPADSAGTTPGAVVGGGRVLAGRYELGATLGSGGMATVWLAHDRVLDRDVAVKVLREQYAADPVFLARFTREALHAARLNHPGLVTIFDTGVDHGTAFIVMEAVHGRTLRDVLKSGGPLSVERAVAVAASVCEVLDVAHRGGVVHRDIKPGNILICDDGRTRVFDFGIARTDGSDPLTQTATVIGTAAYLSPEQAAGRSAGPRSDLYSLGCVLVEMLTGSPPFTADTPVALLYQHVNDAPTPPSATAPQVPAELDAVVLRLLAKDPASRPDTADRARQELLAAAQPARGDTLLLPTLAEASADQRPPRRPTRRAVLAAGIIAAALAVGLLLGLNHPVSTPVAAGSPSSSPTPSTTTSPATASTPPAAPAPIAVPTATTARGALDALRSVIQTGQATQLIDPSAAAQLSSAADNVASALSRGRGKSATSRVQDLANLVSSLAAAGQLAAQAVGPLQDAVNQLSALVGAEVH
jgi:eukaryotic-like serine/threonine-protein kinase